MKSKRLLLLLLFALMAPWAVAQQSLPYSYGFENNDLSADGWELQGATSSYTGINSSAAQTGSYGFRFNYSEQSAYLVSPILTGGNNGIALTLSYKESSNSYGDEQFQVGYTTDETVTDAANFTYGSVVTASLSWQNYEYTFPAGTKRIAVKYIYNDALYLYLDDFIFEAPSSCPKPSGLTATANGQSATLTWIGDASSFHVAYSTDGTANPDDLTYTTVNTNSYTKDNLALDADHYFWVRAYCSATEQSNWAGPASVHIGYCVPAPTSVDGNGISNVTFGTGDYVVNNDTPKATYTDYSSQIGAVQAGVESTIAITFATGYTYNTYVWVDLDNSLSFDADEVVCYGESASTSPTTLTLNFTIPADQTLGDFRLRIGSADSGLGTDPAAANPCYSSSYGCFQDYTLRVLEAPSCLTPTGLAVNYTGGLTATATWDGTADTYNIDVNGNVTNNVTAPYTINGLELATTYAVMVQANCAGNETSEWSNPISFNTDLCMPENMCELTFELTDAWGDGWNGAYIEVIDVLTGATIAQMANENLNGTQGSGENEVNIKTLAVCDGREIQFVWHTGSFDSEASYVVTDINGEVIFEGSGAMSEPVNYTVSCTISTCRKPTDLAASEIGSRSAVLSWTENGEATAWIIKCNGEVTVREATNPYTLTGLEPETAYTVQVCPVCEVEKWSDEISFTTDVACPAPHNLAAGNITSNSAVISWTGEGASYDLRVGTIESSGDRSTLFYGFEDGFGDWTNIDADGDGYPWMTLSNLSDYTSSYSNPESWAYEGSNAVLSGSFINGLGALASVNNYLVSPQVVLGGYISFYAKGMDANYPEHFGVAVSTTGTNPNDFVMVDEWDTDEDTEYHLYTVDLSAYTGMGYIALRNFCLGSDMYIVVIDNVTIEEGIMGEITWGDPITGVTSPYTLNDLDPETQYFVQVRANCGDEGYSEWTQTSFRTKGLCDVPTNLTATNVEARTATLNWNGVQDSYNVQYRTAFHRNPAYFTTFNTSDDTEGWTWTGNIIYGLADPVYGYSSSENYFLQMGWATTEEAYIISPELPAYESGSTLEFYYFAYQYANTFQVGYSSTTNDMEAFEWSDPIDAGIDYYSYLFSEVLPDGVKYVAFKATAEAQGYCIFIDDFGIFGEDTPAGDWVTATVAETSLNITGLAAETEYEWQVQGINRSCDGGVTEWSAMATFTTAPSCLVPTNLDVKGITSESAIVAWESGAALFDIEVNGTVTEGVTNPYDLVDLDPATIYTVRVRANCGVEDGYSDWTEPYAFVTECGGAKDLPYAYDFEDLGDYYACWSAASYNTENAVSVMKLNNNTVFRFSSYSSASDYRQVLVSPALNAEAFVNVSFDYMTSNTSAETFQVGYCTLDNPTDLEDFTFGDEIVVNNNTSWATYSKTLPAGTKYVAILYSSNYQYYLYVDNFRFREITQMTELVEGWNRVSLYVEVDDPIDMLDMLKESLGENGLLIEAPNSTTEFDGEEWFGDLDDEGVYNEEMYLIEVIRDCTIELEGTPADPADHEITIESGWNRIGFPSAEEVDVIEALADFEAEEGDVIESIEGTTEFDGEEWFGDLETFVPGQGYYYKSFSDETKTLVFLTGAKKARSAQPVYGILMFKRQSVKAVHSEANPIQMPNTKQVMKMK